MTWDDFRAIRFGLWIKSPTTLRDYAEKIGMHAATQWLSMMIHLTLKRKRVYRDPGVIVINAQSTRSAGKVQAHAPAA